MSTRPTLVRTSATFMRAARFRANVSDLTKVVDGESDHRKGGKVHAAEAAGCLTRGIRCGRSSAVDARGSGVPISEPALHGAPSRQDTSVPLTPTRMGTHAAASRRWATCFTSRSRRCRSGPNRTSTVSATRRTATTEPPASKCSPGAVGRRLITSPGDIGATAYAVGYERPSRFSREYRRESGASPSEDAQHLRRNRRPVPVMREKNHTRRESAIPRSIQPQSCDPGRRRDARRARTARAAPRNSPRPEWCR